MPSVRAEISRLLAFESFHDHRWSELVTAPHGGSVVTSIRVVTWNVWWRYGDWSALPAGRPPGGWFVPERCWIEGTDPVSGVQPSDHYAVVADLRCVCPPAAEHAAQSRGPDHVGG